MELLENPEEEEANSEIHDRFSPIQVRVMSLLALGWTLDDAAARAHTGSVNMVIRRCRELTGLKNAGVGQFYVRHLLPYDTQGGYRLPGEKRAAWVASAERRREQLQEGSELGPVVFEAITVQAHIDHADLPDEELAKLMTRPTSAASFRDYMARAATRLRMLVLLEQGMTDRRLIMPHGRQRLLTIASLAPFTR
jgi:hypothetical protein